jgi:hypothetical protein
MRGYTDEWLEKQLRRKAERYRLPGPNTVLYPDTAGLGPEAIPKHLETDSIGCPLFAMVEDDKRWTLLGTQAVLAQDHGALTKVWLADVQQVTAANLGQMPKEQYQYLELLDSQQHKSVVWAPSGPEFFALWSLLKWVVQLPPKKRPAEEIDRNR